MLSQLVAAAAPALAGGVADAISEPRPPTMGERIQGMFRGRVGSIVGLVLVGGAGYAGYQSGYLVPARFVAFAQPVCPETKFQYSPPFSNVQIEGTIKSTIQGWQAQIDCGSFNSYSGPPLVCKQIWVKSFGFPSVRQQSLVYVRQEDAKATYPRPINPGYLQCGGQQKRLLEAPSVEKNAVGLAEAPARTESTSAVALAVPQNVSHSFAFSSHVGWLAAIAFAAVTVPLAATRHLRRGTWNAESHQHERALVPDEEHALEEPEGGPSEVDLSGW